MERQKSVNGTSTIFDFSSWIMYGQWDAANPQSTYRQPRCGNNTIYDITSASYNWAPIDNVSDGYKFPAHFRVRFQPGTKPFQQVSTQNPLLKSQHFLLQLSIWVLIVSQHDQYVACAVPVALSPHGFRFAIRHVFVGSRSKTTQFRLTSPMISQLFNKYLSDCKFDWRRSKRG